MREGSLDKPERRPLDWQSPEFYDVDKLDAELRRVFDICHTCRRCFNLCDSFPKLFDLIDESPTMELDSVKSEDFKPVVDACTLCDMCFVHACPYVPPHPFNIDFPHLMLRARVVERKLTGGDRLMEQLTATDRNGRLGAAIAPVANWAAKTDNGFTRPLMEKALKIDARAELPKFAGQTFSSVAKRMPLEPNKAAPGYGRRAVIYATCFVNYNNPDIGHAARAVLAENGVETEVVYPACCGMPQLERGNVEKVVSNAKTITAELLPWVDKGYDVIALVPSCALMMKHEWKLLMPDDADVARLSGHAFDISEYLVGLAKQAGLAPGLTALPAPVTLHLACHARALNIGAKAAELLKLIPGADIKVVERCSGHGGSWGVEKQFFDTALKVGKPAGREVVKAARPILSSECPLAGSHLTQVIETLVSDQPAPESIHPIQLFARAYGLA